MGGGLTTRSRSAALRAQLELLGEGAQERDYRSERSSGGTGIMETNIEVRSELRFERGDNYRGPGVLLGVILTYETDRARRAAAEVRSGERASLSVEFLFPARANRFFCARGPVGTSGSGGSRRCCARMFRQSPRSASDRDDTEWR